ESDATSKLRQGERIVVLRESAKYPGWLEIEPPADSFSWINSRFLKKQGQYLGFVYTTEDAPAPVYAGSRVIDKEPSVEVGQAKRGVTVTIIGPDKIAKNGSGSWVPIEPTNTEERYIPKDAVARAGPVQAAAQGSGGGSGQALKAQADELVERARLLYQQAAGDGALDPNMRLVVLNRLNSLNGGSSGQPAGHPAN